MSVTNGPNAVSIPKNMRMNVLLFFLSMPLNFFDDRLRCRPYDFPAAKVIHNFSGSMTITEQQM